MTFPEHVKRYQLKHSSRLPYEGSSCSSHFNPFHPSLFSFLLFFSLCLTESYTCHSRAFQLRLCERRELRPVDVLLGDVLTERDHLEADVLTLSVTIQP